MSVRNLLKPSEMQNKTVENSFNFAIFWIAVLPPFSEGLWLAVL